MTKNENIENESQIENTKEILKECPVGCGRSFNEENLEKHIKICEKN